MGALVCIVGNVASGKTTLTRRLAEHSDFVPYYEQHNDMLYQSLFAENPRKYGLANQVDYFLFRAGQEQTIRGAQHTGISDGGLDLDYHLFSHLFHHKGYLDAAEFELCERLFTTLRASLPAPDVIVHLQAPIELLEERWRQRARQIDAEISTIADLPVLQGFLDKYVGQVEPHSLITLDATQDLQLEELIAYIQERLHTGLRTKD